MALEPDKTVTKLLLSSTSRFVGEYKSDDWLLTHAWRASCDQVHGRLGIYENPLSRNFYVLAFKHPEFQQESVVVPNYTATGDNVCTYLSILFGKRFENHGRIESHGDFYVPSLPSPGKAITPWLPFNSHRPRNDIGIALNLSEVTRLAPLWDEEHEITSQAEARARTGLFVFVWWVPTGWELAYDRAWIRESCDGMAERLGLEYAAIWPQGYFETAREPWVLSTTAAETLPMLEQAW